MDNLPFGICWYNVSKSGSALVCNTLSSLRPYASGLSNVPFLRSHVRSPTLKDRFFGAIIGRQI